jgi:hypothetical protein
MQLSFVLEARRQGQRGNAGGATEDPASLGTGDEAGSQHRPGPHRAGPVGFPAYAGKTGIIAGQPTTRAQPRMRTYSWNGS